MRRRCCHSFCKLCLTEVLQAPLRADGAIMNDDAAMAAINAGRRVGGMMLRDRAVEHLSNVLFPLITALPDLSHRHHSPRKLSCRTFLSGRGHNGIAAKRGGGS
jgi:hypothetical protein